MAKELPPPELLRKLLRYDPETGKLFWRKRGPDQFYDSAQSKSHKSSFWNSKYDGNEALTSKTKKGYLAGRICQKYVLAHRVVWAVYYGAWPELQIDHIDNAKDNNRVENLRLSTNRQNKYNSKPYRTNTSGFKGVSYCKKRRKWVASIQASGKKINLGGFDSPHDAHKAYSRASASLHGSFGRIE